MDNYEAFSWLDSALLPITEQSPCGSDPRKDVSPGSGYYLLKDLRMTARNAERNGLIDDEPLTSFSHLWQPLIDQIPTLLTDSSKDFEFLAWLIEGLVRLYGFKGMAVGYFVASQCIETYWTQLHPRIDEDGVEARVSALLGLNGIESEGTLIFPLSSIPLTIGDAGEEYAYWQYQQAVDLSRLPKEKQEARIQKGATSMESIINGVNSMPIEHVQSIHQDIQLAIEEYKRFSKILDEACEMPMPSSYILHKMDSILSAFRHLAEEPLKRIEKSQVTSNDQATVNQMQTNKAQEPELQEGDMSVQAASIPILPFPANVQAREQAIETLHNVAEFFRKTEPHSPVSYTIEQIIRWCEMPLPDLLAELISDGDAKQSYFRLVGIKQEDKDS